jgi:hypothetical protein
MSETNIKDMRKQLRNIVQECLNETWIKEVNTMILKEVMKHVDQRLDSIQSHINNQLNVMDKRSKDIASSMIRAIPPLMP